MADNPPKALSLNALRKMLKDVGKAISTYEDWQKALNGSCTGHMTCGA